MKLLVVASVFVLCFFGSTVGLKCYQCKDESISSRCEETIIKTCPPEFGYCGTLSLVEKSGDSYVQKACVPTTNRVCELGEPTELGEDPLGRAATLLCCEGNLCNSSNKLTYKNALLYAFLLGCVFSLVNFL